MNSNYGKLINHDLHKFLSPAILLVTIFIFLYIYLFKKFDLIIPSLMIVIPMLFGVIWIVYHKDPKNNFLIFGKCDTLLYVGILSYILSFIVSINSQMRPLNYFLCIALFYTIIFFLATQSNLNDSAIILLIILFDLNLIVNTAFKYSMWICGGDTFAHIYYTYFTLHFAHNIPSSLNIFYANYPSYNFLSSIVALISSTSPKDSIFILGIFVIIFIQIIIYYTFRYVTRNSKISILAVLFLSISSPFIYYVSYPVPRIAAFALYALFLYILIKDKTIKSSFLAQIILISMVIYHGICVYQLIFITVLIWMIQKIMGTSSNINRNIFINLLIFTLSYSFYVAGSVSTSIIEYLDFQIELFYQESQESLLEMPISSDYFDIFRDHLNASIVLFFFILGVYYCLKHTDYSRVLAVISMIFILLYIPNPIKQNPFVFTTLGFYRFEFFVLPFIALMAAYGLLSFAGIMNAKNRILSRTLILFLCFALTLSSLVSSENATDLNMNTPSKYFSYRDSSLLFFLENNFVSNSYVYSDLVLNRLISQYKYFEKIENYNLIFFRANILQNIRALGTMDGYKIIRFGEYKERGLLLFNPRSNEPTFLYSKENINIIKNSMNNNLKIYNSGDHGVFYR